MSIPGLKNAYRLFQFANPFTFTSNYDRPAPPHVLNGFVASYFGYTSFGAKMRDFIGGATDKAGELFPSGWANFLEQEQWTKDFQHDLKSLVDPTKRVWVNRGSPFPIHTSLSTNDPSDNQLGPLVTAILRQNDSDHTLADSLHKLFRPSTPTDPISAIGAAIGRHNEATLNVREPSASSQKWLETRKGTYGSEVFRNYYEFVCNVTAFQRYPHLRLANLQHLSRALFFVALHAHITGSLIASEIRSGEPPKRPRFFVWGGQPPGSPDENGVKVAGRSFAATMSDTSRYASYAASQQILEQEIPDTVPEDQRLRSAIRLILSNYGDSADRVEKILDEIQGDASVDITQVPLTEEALADVLQTVYDPITLGRSFRSMGSKIGFAGPDRGNGTPRFVCETPLLGTFVWGILGPDRSMDFDSFLEALDERFGIVFTDVAGADECVTQPLGLPLSQQHQVFRDNREHLRTRLVRAGLAKSYSDGHTEVTSNAAG